MPLQPSGDELAQAVFQRRKALRDEAKSSCDSKVPALGDDAPLWGLALSGGGIRSATFCLGLLRSLAANGLLLRFDVLSTVSGGGYIGGMVGRLFDRARAGAGAREVNDAIAQAEKTHFGWWVRANGRYLTPAGARDTLFALSLYLRNLIGIHVEFGIIAVLAALALCAVDLLAWHGLYLWGGQAPGLFDWIDWLQPWIPTLWLVAPLAMLAAACHILAYWQLHWARAGRIVPFVGWVVATNAAIIVALTLGGHQTGGSGALTGSMWRTPMLYAALVLVALGISSVLTARFIAGGPLGSIGAARNALTRGLSRSLNVLGICLVFGVLERLAWALAFESFATTDLGLALGAAAVGLRGAAPLLTSQGHRAPAWVRAMGAWSLQAVGYLLGLCLLIWWIAVVMKVVMAPAFEISATGAVAAGRKLTLVDFSAGWAALAATSFLVLGYALLTGRNTEFLNLSSLHTFYAARLTRAYLGAANGARFGAGVNALSPIGGAVRTGTPEVSVGEVATDDDTDLGAYAPHASGGPVHIINTCVNQSAADKGRIFNRDRKGMLLSVMAGGASQLGQEGWKRVAGIGNLSLGSWLAISGAAVSPGLGARTQRGLAALLTFGGVRLGYWLTRGQRDPQEAPPRGAWLRRHFAKSIGLLDETTGSFAAAGRNDWFISDGGHFENTGAYALLAARAQFILVADCGADPDYQFGDLENLVRKARVDLDTEITFQKPSMAALPEWSQTLSYFGSLNALAADDNSACLALATVRYPAGGSDEVPACGILIVIKPNMCAGLPMDIENYRLQCPAFPQQPTIDQSFSESQWESYFSLGRFLAGKIDATFVNDVLRHPDRYFEPDDMLASQAHGDNAAPAPAGKPSAGMRLSPRIGVAAVGATLSAGAVATIAVSAWQAAESVRASISARVNGERAAMKDLVDLWATATTDRPHNGAAGPAGALPSGQGQAGDPKATTALAAAILRAADAYCRSNNAEWLRHSTLGMRIVADAKAACQAQGSAMNNTCVALVSSSDGPWPPPFPGCLTRSDELPGPRYWAYDYSRDGSWAAIHPCSRRRERMVLVEESFKLANSGMSTNFGINRAELADIRQEGHCAAIASDPPPPRAPAPPVPAAPQPAPAATAAPDGQALQAVPPSTSPAPQPPWKLKNETCKGVTIYVQIYRPADRETVRGFREWWRNWGASVPPIEDVYDSARRNGRGNPAPVSSTVLRYHDARAQECAVAISSAIGIASAGATRWGPEALNPALKASAGVIELWVRPDDHLLRAIQARVAAD